MNGQPWSRRFLAPILALLIVGATVVPPLLDAAEGPRVAQFEAEHDAAACAPLHNHEACIQLAKNLGRTAWGWTQLVRLDATPRSECAPAEQAGPPRSFTLLPPSRGPPTLLV